MAVDLVVPTLGESISEAVVGKWNKKPGDAVKADEPLVVLETDKVTVDVPAPAAGTMESIKFKEGDKVKVGEVLGTIAPGAGGSVSKPAEKPAQTPAAAVAASTSGEGAKATPVARNIMEDKGIDPAKVKGTGPGGRIHKDDVLQYGNGAVVAKQPEPTRAPPVPSGPRQNAEREERVKMTPLRKRVAERLLSAQQNAAILTTFNEVDMGAVMALRKQYQDGFVKKHGVKLGFMSFFVRATIEALKAFPSVNAEISGEEVIYKHYYDIGVAVSGTRGLVVPVLRDADRLSMAELEKQIAAYGEKARADKLTLADLQGGTFTISNGGIFGSMLSTPILNPPQTGILGMHNIVERPVAKNGEVVIRPVMYLALSYDHRLIDGREAVQFLVRIKDCIEDPSRILLEI
ncbi:MAG: 2-oxoglutarate dehydrogenase complex dihydrolipoyllysine-residue succinyltransferase [Myxococcaceae bacterium]